MGSWGTNPSYPRIQSNTKKSLCGLYESVLEYKCTKKGKNSKANHLSDAHKHRKRFTVPYNGVCSLNLPKQIYINTNRHKFSLSFINTHSRFSNLPRTILQPRSFIRALRIDKKARICRQLMLPSGQEKGRIDRDSSSGAIPRNRT